MKYKKWQNRLPPFNHQVLGVTTKIGSFSGPSCFNTQLYRRFFKLPRPGPLEKRTKMPPTVKILPPQLAEENQRLKDLSNDTQVTGRTHLFFPNNWKMLTQNKFARSLVNGIKIKFIETPVQTRIPPPLRFTDTEAACVDQEVESLLRRGAIHRVEQCDSQFVSNVFLQPKKSGGLCLIINL